MESGVKILKLPALDSINQGAQTGLSHSANTRGGGVGGSKIFSLSYWVGGGGRAG